MEVSGASPAQRQLAFPHGCKQDWPQPSLKYATKLWPRERSDARSLESAQLSEREGQQPRKGCRPQPHAATTALFSSDPKHAIVVQFEHHAPLACTRQSKHACRTLFHTDASSCCDRTAMRHGPNHACIPYIYPPGRNRSTARAPVACCAWWASRLHCVSHLNATGTGEPPYS